MALDAAPVRDLAGSAFCMVAYDGAYLYLAASAPRHPSVRKDAPSYAGRPYDADLGPFDRVSFALDINRDYRSAYRFDVADGTYRVDLRFAEIQKTKAGQRFFDVLLEGEVALYRLDLVAAAGANTAYDQTFMVTVTDGHLDIDFVAQAKGDKAVINAILVTEIPEGIPAP